MNLLNILAIVQLCPLSMAMDCKNNPGACVEDELSLMQFTNSLAHRIKLANESAVETAQNDLKATASNTSVQQYANSVARVNKAKMQWKAARAALDAEGKSQKKVYAERAAKESFEAAQDEAHAWKVAMNEEQDAAVKAAVADNDAASKHEAAKQANVAASAAHKARLDAEKASKETKIMQQALVNDANAEATAKFALDAKMAAAQALAIEKTAKEDADAKTLAARQDARLSWKSQKAAIATEWKAHKSSVNAQRKMMAAAAAGMEGDVAAQVEAAVAALQESNDTIDVTLNTTHIDEVSASASAIVGEAEAGVDQALSDAKKADAAASVANYAAERAAWAKKASQAEADAAWMKAKAAQHRAAHKAKLAREAQERAKQAEFEFNMSAKDNLTAQTWASEYEKASYQQAANYRDAMKTQREAKRNLTAQLANATAQMVIDDANASVTKAMADAHDAAIARAVADMTANFSQTSNAKLADATNLYKEAQKNRSSALKLSDHAQGQAVSAAYHHRNSAWAVADLQNKSADAQTDTTIVTQTTQTQVLN